MTGMRKETEYSTTRDWMSLINLVCPSLSHWIWSVGFSFHVRAWFITSSQGSYSAASMRSTFKMFYHIVLRDVCECRSKNLQKLVMINKMSNCGFGYPHALWDMFTGVYQAPLSFMMVREDDSHKPALVHTMSSMQSEHFKRQNILLSTELKVYCWCTSNLANSDTSTAKKLSTHTEQQMAKTNLLRSV